MDKKYVPCFNLNVPNGGPQQQTFLKSTDPVFSLYTGDFICNGPLPKGMPTDAQRGMNGYGKNFHVIEYNPANQTFMAHGVK